MRETDNRGLMAEQNSEGMYERTRRTWSRNYFLFLLGLRL